MRHPTDGTLRRLLDEPAGVADADQRHVAGCSECTSGLARAGADATATSAALAAGTAPDLDVDAAWARLMRHPSDTPSPVVARRRERRSRLRSPAVAAVAALTLVTGAGVAAANDWLPIFRTQQVAPVQVTSADLVQLPDLSRYGDVAVSGDAKPHAVADAAAAQDATGLSVPRVDQLPPGVEGAPQYEVAERVTVTFTFSAAKAAQAATGAGTPLPAPPAGLDGSRLRITAGPGAAAVWSRGSSGLPALVVARVVGPAVDSSDVSYDVLRDYLLSLPGLPADLATQLRTVSTDAATLPLPVPADVATTTSADVRGFPATVLTTRDGTMSAVVWVENGAVTAVAGSLGSDRVLAVARSLR